MLVIIWRGLGGLGIIIMLITCLVTQVTCDLIGGERFYDSHPWATLIYLAISGLLIARLGIKHNVNEKQNLTGQEKNKQHSIFCIPLQYFGPLLIFFGIFFTYESYRRLDNDIYSMKNPQMGDLYITDLDFLFKEANINFKWGILRVKNVIMDQVELSVSNGGYNFSSDPQKDIRSGAASQHTYYSSYTFSITKKELLDLRKSFVIEEIHSAGTTSL